MVAASGGGGAVPALTLDRIFGQTCLANSALAVNPATGDVAYPAGCVVVIYQPRRNRQVRYFRAGKAVSCMAYSQDGGMLAVGERGPQPSIVIWDTATGVVLRELKGGHRFGVGCVAFSPNGRLLVSCGFKYDRSLQLWNLGLDSDSSHTNGHSNGQKNRQSNGHAGPPRPPPAGVARRVGCARVGQKIRAVSFSEDGSYFVTCGDRHVKFWFPPTDAEALATANVANGGVAGSIGVNSSAATTGAGDAADAPPPPPLEGRPASIIEALRNAVFMDIACGGGGSSGSGSGGGSVYCVTSTGLLCVFSRDRVMEQWLSLEAPTAYAVSLLGNFGGNIGGETGVAANGYTDENFLAVACADGLVRLFEAGSLRYVATLPRPPPLGRANVATMAQLHAEAAAVDAAAAAKSAESLAETSESLAGNAEENADGSSAITSAFSAVLRYPAALAVRLLPSGDKLVVAYADRGLFIWDIADPHNVGKYRSFLNHNGCIWDVQNLPPESAAVGLGANVIATCSADKTIRFWNLLALDGSGAEPSSPAISSAVSSPPLTSTSSSSIAAGKWTNIYSKYLLRVLYVDSPTAEQERGGDSSHRAAGSGNGRGSDSRFGGNNAEIDGEINGDNDNSGAGRSGVHEAAAAAAAAEELSHDLPNVEVPPKPDWPVAPRSLAVHPLGTELAAGDKCGNLKVFDLAKMRLRHVQAAHDAEVLSLSYSPLLGANEETAGGIGGIAAGGEGAVLLASASRDRLVHVFDATNSGDPGNNSDTGPAGNGGGKMGAAARYPLLQTLDMHSSSVMGLKFSRDGRRLVSAGGDKMVCISEVRGRRIMKRQAGAAVAPGTIYGLDVDPTSRFLVTAGQDKRLNIWSLATGRLTRAYRADGGLGGPAHSAEGGETGGGSGGELFKVDLDPAGMYAATCSFDKWIRLFDFFSGRCLARVAGHSELVTGVRFSGDGRRLISIGGDGCIFVWRLSAELHRAMAERLAEMRPPTTRRLAAPELPLGLAANGSDTRGEAAARLRYASSKLPAWAHTRAGNASPAAAAAAAGVDSAAASEQGAGGASIGTDAAVGLPPAVAAPLRGRWMQRQEQAAPLLPPPPTATAAADPANVGDIDTYEDDFEQDAAGPSSREHTRTPENPAGISGAAAENTEEGAPATSAAASAVPATVSTTVSAAASAAVSADSEDPGEESAFFQSGDTEAELSVAFRVHPSAVDSLSLRPPPKGSAEVSSPKGSAAALDGEGRVCGAGGSSVDVAGSGSGSGGGSGGGSSPNGSSFEQNQERNDDEQWWGQPAGMGGDTGLGDSEPAAADAAPAAAAVAAAGADGSEAWLGVNAARMSHSFSYLRRQQGAAVNGSQAVVAALMIVEEEVLTEVPPPPPPPPAKRLPDGPLGGSQGQRLPVAPGDVAGSDSGSDNPGRSSSDGDKEAIFPQPPPPPETTREVAAAAAAVAAAPGGDVDVLRWREKRRETEDAVDNMRRRLAAMGFLQQPASGQLGSNGRAAGAAAKLGDSSSSIGWHGDSGSAVSKLDNSNGNAAAARLGESGEGMLLPPPPPPPQPPSGILAEALVFLQPPSASEKEAAAGADDAHAAWARGKEAPVAAEPPLYIGDSSRAVVVGGGGNGGGGGGGGVGGDGGSEGDSGGSGSGSGGDGGGGMDVAGSRNFGPLGTSGPMAPPLPRKHAEYAEALARLQEAAVLASSLYRELEYSSSVSAAASRGGGDGGGSGGASGVMSRRSSFPTWDSATPAAPAVSAGRSDQHDESATGTATDSLLFSYRESFAQVSGMLGSTGALAVPNLLAAESDGGSAFGSVSFRAGALPTDSHGMPHGSQPMAVGDLGAGHGAGSNAATAAEDPRFTFNGAILEQYSEALLRAFDQRVEAIVAEKIPRAVAEALSLNASVASSARGESRDGDGKPGLGC